MKNERKQKTLVELLELNDFHLGRMISNSKSSYRKEYPDNLVVFNAQIYERQTYYQLQNSELHNEEVWYGDLDLTKDLNSLYRLIRDKKDIVICYENGTKILELEGIYKINMTRDFI